MFVINALSKRINHRKTDICILGNNETLRFYSLRIYINYDISVHR